MPPLPAAIVALPCHLARGTVCRGALPPAPLSLAPHSPGSGAQLFAAPARAADGEALPDGWSRATAAEYFNNLATVS